MFFHLLAVFFLGTAPSIHAEEPAVLELRRTFSTQDCSTGDVYINGKLAAVFYASTSTFNERLKKNPFLGDSLVTEIFESPAPYLKKTVFGMRLGATAPDAIKLLLLDEDSYWNYDRPRKKIRSLAPDTILMGTRVLNRECRISAGAEDNYYDSNWAMAWTTNLIAPQLFGTGVNRQNFPAGKSSSTITILSDQSGKWTVTMGSTVFARVSPPRTADSISDGDPCLTKLEHGSNTRIHTGNVKTYTRRDDVWFCTEGALTGVASANALEFRRDIRYLEIISHEICSTVLGLPINRVYLISRTADGTGGASWTRCLTTEDWVQLADKTGITTLSNY